MIDFQNRVASAHVALFHDDPTDVQERLNRFFEEATELAQALGMTRGECHALIEYTFGRPVGTATQEVGGVAVTLASLCILAGIDMDLAAEADLANLQRPETIERIRRKRSTRHGRGPLPGVDPGITPKVCGIKDPTTRDCPNMKEVGGGMEGERYRCDLCGKGYFLDYEDMK